MDDILVYAQQIFYGNTLQFKKPLKLLIYKTMEINKLMPTDRIYPITILCGDNGSGKTNLLNKFVTEYNYIFYTESHYNGLDRYRIFQN